MPKEQRTFTKEFKLEAVRLVQSSGKSITQIARDLGIADSTLHQWCKLQAEQGEQAFPGSGHQTAQEEELRCLKRELETVRQERDMLKKVFTCTHGMSDEVSLYRSASPGVPSAKDVPGVGGLGQWLVCLETATGERSPDRR